MIVQELALDQAAHDGVSGRHKNDVPAVGADVDQLFVVVGQQVADFVHGLAGNDDPDVLDGLDRAFHNGQTVAVQSHDGQFVRLDLKQFTGMRRFFLVLTDGIQGALDHIPQGAGGDGQGLLGSGIGQLGEIGGGHRLDLKLGNAALDGGFAVFGRLDGDLTGGHPADHAAEQFCVQHDLTGFLDVGFDGGHDAHFEVVAGEGELKPFGFQQDAFQHRDGGAGGDGLGNTVNGRTQQGLIADDVQIGSLLFEKIVFSQWEQAVDPETGSQNLFSILNLL